RGCGKKVDDVALVECLLHGGEGKHHRLCCLSADADTGGAAGHTNHLEMDAIHADQFPCGVISFLEEHLIDTLPDDAYFSFLGDVDVVDIAAINHLALLDHVVVGIAALHQVGSVFFTPHHILVLSPGKEY